MAERAGSRRHSARTPGSKPVIQSAARAVQLLGSLLYEPRGKRLSELAEELSLSEVTVRRLVQTLMGEGLVARAAEPGKYAMSTLFWLSIAAALGDAPAVYGGLQPLLDELAQRSGATALLAVPSASARKIVLAAYALPDAPLVARPPAGAATPMHSLAAGKCFLATLSDEALQAWLQGPLESVTEHTITNPEVLQADIKQTRARGYAFHREECVPGCWGLAAPVEAKAGVMAGALQLSAPLNMLSQETIRRWVPLLQHASRHLSQQLTQARFPPPPARA